MNNNINFLIHFQLPFILKYSYLSIIFTYTYVFYILEEKVNEILVMTKHYPLL